MNIPNVTYSSIKLIYTSDVEHTVDMSLSSTYRASFAGNARICYNDVAAEHPLCAVGGGVQHDAVSSHVLCVGRSKCNQLLHLQVA